MADRTVEIQKAIVGVLRAHAGTSALVSSRIYDRAPESATFPFLTLGVVAGIPFDGEALRGMRHIFDVHAWSRTVSAVECRRIVAQVFDALHWADLTLDGGTPVICRVTDRRDFADPVGVTTHGVVSIEIVTDG